MTDPRGTPPASRRADPALPDEYDAEPLMLSDVLNRVLDKGVVIRAHVMISIADVDLIQLDLRLLLTSVATQDRRADLPVRSDPDA